MVVLARQPGSCEPGGRESNGNDCEQGVPAPAGVAAVEKRNSGWSQTEHLLFLLGLHSHGRGAWRAIASDFCISRTPAQVASHAQKYFHRQELTPSQRRKKRLSIHDITCGSIHPSATAADRNAVKKLLQDIVRAGRDISGDSVGDNSAYSSDRSTLSTCLPVQDPRFATVFAFTSARASMAASGSNGGSITIGTAGPQPLWYPAPPPTPGPLLVTPYSHSDAWAVVPAAGTMLHAEPHHHVVQGMYLQPVACPPADQVYATVDHVHHPQNQRASILPGVHPDMHTWPYQHAGYGAVPKTHGPFPGLAASADGVQDSTRLGPPAVLSSSPAAEAMLTGPQPVAGPGHAGGLIVPAATRVHMFEAPPPLQPPPPSAPRPSTTDAMPWQAVSGGSGDRGTKRDSFEESGQGDRPGAFQLHSMSYKMPKGTDLPWQPVMPIPPQHSHPHAPPRPLQSQPQLPAPPNATSASWQNVNTMPEAEGWPGPMHGAGVHAGGAARGSRGGDAPPVLPSRQHAPSLPSVSVSGSLGAATIHIGGLSASHSVARAGAFTADRAASNGVGNNSGGPGDGHLRTPYPPDLHNQQLADSSGATPDALWPAPVGALVAERPSSHRSHSQTEAPLQQSTFMQRTGTPMHHMHVDPSGPPHAPVGTDPAVIAPGAYAQQRSRPQHAIRPRTPVEGVMVMLRRPSSMTQTGAATEHSRPYHRPGQAQQPRSVARSESILTDPAAVAGFTRGPQVEGPGPHREQEVSPLGAEDSIEDFAGRLLNSSAEFGDSACGGMFSWDQGGSGSAGQSGSGSSNAADDRPAVTLQRRRSLP